MTGVVAAGVTVGAAGVASAAVGGNDAGSTGVTTVSGETNAQGPDTGEKRGKECGDRADAKGEHRTKGEHGTAEDGTAEHRGGERGGHGVMKGEGGRHAPVEQTPAEDGAGG